MHVVNENAFGYSILLSLKIPTKREIIQALKKHQLKCDTKKIDELIPLIKENTGKRATTFTLYNYGISLIVFYKWENNASDYGTLVHEIFHAVDMTLRHRGITLSDDSDETYAYHLGYFTREFLNKIW